MLPFSRLNYTHFLTGSGPVAVYSIPQFLPPLFALVFDMSMLPWRTQPGGVLHSCMHASH
jgi:hypothetical protein